MKIQNLDASKYISRVSKKASNIEAKAKARKVRRIVFLGIVILSCVGGIFIGVSGKSKSIETQYKKYVETSNQSLLNNELLSYKNVFKQFESTFLGNQPCQSLMGGFFYEGDDYSIYPDEFGQKMLLSFGDEELTLCEGLASDINVKSECVYYRKLDSRNISSFNISTGTTVEMPLNNVGQFIICGDKLYYVDLATSSLMSFEMATFEIDEIVHSGVNAFVVAGNNIIYLDNKRTLHEVNISVGTEKTIGNNIAEFSYDGKLWMQNNEKVYVKSLDKKAINELHLDIQCNRLLGIVRTLMFVESEDGVYVCSTETSAGRKIAEGTFIGASDDRILIYDSSDGSYRVVTID